MKHGSEHEAKNSRYPAPISSTLLLWLHSPHENTKFSFIIICRVIFFLFSNF